MNKVLVISAIIIFGLAAFGVVISNVSLVPLGLAVYVTADLLGNKN